MLYFGAPEKAVDWFSQLGFRYEQWRDGAVSDWLIDLVSVGFQKPEVSSTVSHMRLCVCVNEACIRFVDRHTARCFSHWI